MKDVFGEGKIIRSMDEFLKEFNNWWIIFLIYACGPLVIWILKIKGWPVDELTYASVITLCNGIMLVRRCSGTEARLVRAELEKAISGYSRALRYLTKKEDANQNTT